MNELTGLLSVMVARDATDLYLCAEAPPTLKIDDHLYSLPAPPLPVDQVSALILALLTRRQRRQYESRQSLDFALSYTNIGRFRINVYREKGSPALVAHYIKHRIPTIEELELPSVLQELALEKRGLILVAGGPGSGRSTTMAAMLNHRNQHSDGHILTVEDPIEFIHPHKKSLVSQREVGLDTPSYADGLQVGLQEMPDVVMIGEILDASTAQQALRYTETGHLCLATLTAQSTRHALEKLIQLFPAQEQPRIQQALSLHLLAAISPRLPRGLDNRRVVATEVLINTPHISSMIEGGRLARIKGALDSPENRSCQSLEAALYTLIHDNRISRLEGLSLADSCIRLAARFALEEKKEPEQSPIFDNQHWSMPQFDSAFYQAAPDSLHQRRPEIF